jgi:peptide/nickel transport system substrate-binding protein
MASRSWTILLALAAAAVMAVSACGAAGGGAGQGASTVGTGPYKPQPGATGGKIVYSDWEQVSDLNPLANTANTAAQAEVVLWQFLWTNGPDNKPVPQLVSEVPTEKNGMVKVPDKQHMDITIKLLPGLKWSDGQPLTTADVKFTWEAICDPMTGASSTIGWDHISSMDIKSPTEMLWHFGPNKKGTCGLLQDLTTGIYAPYQASLAMPVLPQHVLGSTPHSQWLTAPYFSKGPTVVSGPYMVKSFTPGTSAQLVMVPNPHFIDGREHAAQFNHKPYLNQLIYQIYGDKASQINALKTGDADVGLDLIVNDLPATRAITDAETKISYPLQDELVMFNLGNNTTGCGGQQWAQSCGKPTVFKDDQPLRQALSLATDKATLNKQLVGGKGKVMNGPLVPTFAPWYNTSLPAFRYDVAKAKKMLDADGWKMGSDGVRHKNGRALEFQISTTTGNPQRQAEEELLRHDWGQVGAKVNISNHQADELFPAFSEGGVLSTGQFDAALYAYVGAPDPDSWGSFAEVQQIPTAANPGAGNSGRWTDQKLNDLFIKGTDEVDPAKRKQIYDQAQVEWERYAGDIDLYQRPEVSVVSPSVGNYAPGSPQPAYDVWNAADWFHKK